MSSMWKKDSTEDARQHNSKKFFIILSKVQECQLYQYKIRKKNKCDLKDSSEVL